MTKYFVTPSDQEEELKTSNPTYRFARVARYRTLLFLNLFFCWREERTRDKGKMCTISIYLSAFLALSLNPYLVFVSLSPLFCLFCFVCFFVVCFVSFRFVLAYPFTHYLEIVFFLFFLFFLSLTSHFMLPFLLRFFLVNSCIYIIGVLFVCALFFF